MSLYQIRLKKIMVIHDKIIKLFVNTIPKMSYLTYLFYDSGDVKLGAFSQ